jgi:transposase
MTVHGQRNDRTPEETARLLHIALPKGNVYTRMRDELGELFRDEEFMKLYSTDGKPAESPGRLAMVTLMQFVENLTDRPAAEAVQVRIDWKYALGLALEDEGFDYSVLSEFRSRLITKGAEAQLFDKLLEVCQTRGLVKAARLYQATAEFKERYNVRAGVEGTISQCIAAFGIRVARYFGLAKTKLEHLLCAAAMNFVRIDRWLAGTPLAKTRKSKLAHFAVAVA